MSKVFSERLTSLRKERYPSQKEGAAALDVSISRYNKWETDTNSPDYETVCMIAAHYGVTTDYLLGHSEARHPENILVVTELGLTEKSIEVINSLKERFPSDLGEKKILRTSLDVLNELLSLTDNEMIYRFLSRLGSLTNPAIDTWPNAVYIDDLKGEGYPIKAIYRQDIHDTLDEIVKRMTEQTHATWDNVIGR